MQRRLSVLLGMALFAGAGGAVFSYAMMPPGGRADPLASDQGYDYLKNTADLQLLENRYAALDDACRGGSGDDPATDKACQAREELAAYIRREAHYCYSAGPATDLSPEEAANAQPAGWSRCR